MTSFLAILSVLDDVELLPSAIRHLERIGVDRIIAVDGGSTDGSLEILIEAERSRAIWRLHVANGELGAVDRIKAEQARSSDADWVIFVDTDEFLSPASGSLHDIGDTDGVDVLSVFRYNVVLGPTGPELPDRLQPETYSQALLYARPITTCEAGIASEPEECWLARSVEPKVIVRPAAIHHIAPGDHVVTSHGRRSVHGVANQLLIACAPITNLGRFTRELASGPGPVVAESWAHGDDDRLRRLSEAGPTSTDLARAIYDDQRVDDSRLAVLRERQVVRSVSDVFDRLVPVFESDDDHSDGLRRTQPWLTLAGRVCTQEGISVEGGLECLLMSSFPAVLVPPDYVIKLFSPWRDGHTVREMELGGLRRAGRSQELPVPGLVAEGRLDDVWRYIVIERLDGENFTWLWESLDSDTVRRVASWLGAFARGIRAVELDVTEREADRARFATMVKGRHEQASRLLADRGALSERLIEQVDAWLPSPDEMLETYAAEVLLHGALQDDHIMARPPEKPGGFAPTGVIDFGESHIGHPLYELGPAWWTLLNVDRTYTDAFLEAARLPGWQEPGFARMAMAWTLIRCAWNPKAPPFLGEARDLDELAELSFGELRLAD